MAPVKIAILASGSGTTAERFITDCVNGRVAGDVVLVIANNKNAQVFGRVAKLNNKHGLDIKTANIGKSTHPPKDNEEVEYGHQTSAEEQAILKELKSAGIDLVLLLGYMKLVGKSIVEKYGWRDDYMSVYQARMLNTHPGLLPATKGLFGIHVQERVIAGKLEAGHCLFAVDSEYDDGPVIAEHKVQVDKEDTPESLFERVKDSEKIHLAEDINGFIVEQKKYMGVE